VILADDSTITTTGLWGVVGVIAAGLLGLAGDYLRRRWGASKRDGEAEPRPSSEKVAADAASREILTWTEQHIIAPMRIQLAEITARLDQAQATINSNERDLAEARATIRELRQRLTALEQQLTERQGQITLLLRQLGDRHEQPERTAEPPEPSAGSDAPRPAV
jgi:septal ring factor EnvC (AmiA/AmiB activator)